MATLGIMKPSQLLSMLLAYLLHPCTLYSAHLNSTLLSRTNTSVVTIFSKLHSVPIFFYILKFLLSRLGKNVHITMNLTNPSRVWTSALRRPQVVTEILATTLEDELESPERERLRYIHQTRKETLAKFDTIPIKW